MRNLGWLLAGKGVGAVLSLVYLALAARTLGAAGFGEFTLVLGTAQAVTALVGFQTWQIVVRFGVPHLRAGRAGALGRLIGFCTALDVAGALAGCVVVAPVFLLLGPRLGWDRDLAWFGLLFCVVSLLSVRSTPVGILRLHDRFGVGAAADAVTPVVRFVGALAVVGAGSSVRGFLLAWGIAEVATAAAYWICAGRAAPLRWPGWRGHRRVAAENPGLWRMSWYSNAAYTLENVSRPVALLLVGLAAGAAGAGEYRVASQLSQALARLSEMLSRAMFAEMAHAEHGNGFGTLLRRSTAIMVGAGAVIAVLLVVAGRPALALLAGPSFAGAYPLLLLLGAGAVLDLAGTGFEPALLAKGLAGLVLRIRGAATLCLFLGVAVLLPPLGTTGAALAVLGSSAAGLVLFGIAVARRVSPAGVPRSRPASP